MPFLEASCPSPDSHTFLVTTPLATHASVEDCPQGMHQDLSVFLARAPDGDWPAGGRSSFSLPHFLLTEQSGAVAGDRGNSGKIEVARNLFPTHKIISLELVEDVCEIFLKKSHHIPVFWQAEVEIFFRTGIVGGSSPGQLIGNGILYDFRVSSTPCTTCESSEPLHMSLTTHTCVLSHIDNLQTCYCTITTPEFPVLRQLRGLPNPVLPCKLRFPLVFMWFFHCP